jgi:putative cell wall-binding protein
VNEQIITSYPNAINSYGHEPGVMPVYLSNNIYAPFRNPGTVGNIFNWATNDFADLYTSITPLAKQITVSSTGTASSKNVVVASGNVIPSTRMYSDNRYSTAAEISRANWTTANTVVLVSGESYPDALSAGSGAAVKGYPIIYATQSLIPAATQSILNKTSVTKVIIVGGDGTIGMTVSNSLANNGFQVNRLSESSRFDTNIVVQSSFFPSANSAFAATGNDFPDALSAGAAAAKNSAPLLLAPTTVAEVPSATITYLRNKNIQSMKIAGGVATVSFTVERRLCTLI